MVSNPYFEENYDSENLLFAATIKLASGVKHHKRSVYTAFDLLGDVGGLFDALKAIMSYFVALNFVILGNPINDYLLKAIFLQDKSNMKGNNYRNISIPR